MKRLQIFPALLVAFTLVAQDAPKTDVSHLTLEDAIQTALKSNLQVQISEQTRESAKANLQFSEGTFDWLLTSNLTLSHAKSVFENKFFNAGSAPVSGSSTSNFRNWTVGVAKPFEWGGNFQLNYNPSYSYTESNIVGYGTRTTTTPYTGTFSASYTQSLLRNFGRDASATNLIVAQYGSKAADYAFQLAVINQVATTESAYWDVVYAKRDLENKQQALQLAQQQLRENEIRVKVGTLAPIEVTSSEASVAQAEQNIIASEAQLLNAKDALIRILYPTSDRPKGLDTADLPSVKPMDVTEDAAIKQALSNRVELKSAELDLASKKVLERAAKNRILPQLDLTVAYNGTASNYETYSPVNTDLFQAKNPGYSVGLQFSLPIQNRAAKGNQAIARANRRSSELSLHDLELGITLEARQAFRNLDAASKGVTAAQKTRVYREQDLDAERKKFENGMSTNFLVLSKLNDLNTAKASELQAQIAYAKAVTDLEKAMGRLLQTRHLEVK
ncbi:MAG TPA: TolC family protein [Holophagaceae bacterium]